MEKKKFIVATGNQAAAQMAYKTNEVCTIYPITPSSEMSELVEEWSAKGEKNIFEGVPSIFEMQSEAGVAGAMHGAVQTGALATTFTASQGLLLMMPNMYKIAGELTPNVIHVATRSVATHALSVFGDHSDIMAVRNTGYALLGAASVQEAMDFALISQAATLASRIPFVHFFDGFRTSHETAKIEQVTDEVIKSMIDADLINEHRNRALNPEHPVVRGTCQGPDTFFQGREAVNSFYDSCPKIVQGLMDRFAKLTGRSYHLFDYEGHPQAEYVIVAMASATETIAETVKLLNAQGERVGLVKVRLFRPFSAKHLVNALPKSCRSIAVLDRTKEPGATGEPLYLDVLQSVMSEAKDFYEVPKVVGGRFGLSSKELSPGMVKAVVDNLKLQEPKHNFTIGIHDDVTHLSLSFSPNISLKFNGFQGLLYETKSTSCMASCNSMLHLLGNERHVQGYSEIDYKKSEARNVFNLRWATMPIKAPYLISKADSVGCDSLAFLENDNPIERIKNGGKLLVNTSLDTRRFWKSLSPKIRRKIREKDISLFIVDLNAITESYTDTNSALSMLHKSFLALTTYGEVDQNLKELYTYIVRVDTFEEVAATDFHAKADVLLSNTILGKLIAGKGNELPVSAFPVDGTYTTDTSKFTLRTKNTFLPEWQMDACTQCGACSMACPQGAIRMKVFEDRPAKQAPEHFKAVPAIEWEGSFEYALQVNPEQCTGCNTCVDACTDMALTMENTASILERERDNWRYFETIPEFDRLKIDPSKVNQQQLQEPLFKYAGGVDGCGQSPYLKLLSQLFGDRMLVANATGSSSIFGGALPVIPWSKNQQGRGPAWSNSLFEDNAEFGLGYRLTLDQQELQAKDILRRLAPQLDLGLVQAILNAEQDDEDKIDRQRHRVQTLKAQLCDVGGPDALQLFGLCDSLVKKSVWIVGGDGWAYDIGFGGLDHVIASGRNVNILVLDNEVYSNTGGQMSKATPFGATAKFAFNGRQKQKKDLALMAMAYDDVYVASVAIGADREQTLKAFLEAESYDGPSIILAYCHSPAHGIDMKRPRQYHRAAVASGQWPLYRNDPRRRDAGMPSLQLDSGKPSLPIAEYFRKEQRFAKLLEAEKKGNEALIPKLQERAEQKFMEYKSLSQTSGTHAEIMV